MGLSLIELLISLVRKVDKKKNDELRYRFELISPTRKHPLLLQAHNEEEREAWIKSIQVK